MRFNPVLDSLEAYVPGEQPRDGTYVKLNTNESPYPPAPAVERAITEFLADNSLRKYPDPACTKLREALAKRLDVPVGWILVGNGSDEVLRLLCHALLAPGDRIGMLYPTYVLYRTLAAMFGAACEEFDVEPPDFAIPDRAKSDACQILFLANPNPPMGTAYSKDVVEEVVRCAADRLVVVDEAYVDFGGSTAVELVRRYQNVAVTRTFSKSYALAGLRIGFVVAQPPLIEQLEKLKDSYNVNSVSQVAALAAWEAVDYYRELVRKVCETREWLRGELVARGFEVAQSAGNFLFARRRDARELYLALKQRRVLVRWFDQRLLRDGLRITVGTPQETEALLQALDAIDGRTS